MNPHKFLLILILFLCAGLAFAQNATVSFKDNSIPLATYTKLNLEYPGGAYPTGTATGRWKVQFYKDGGDNTISPLDASTHLPTGDDAALTNGNNFQDLTVSVIGPNKVWNATGIIFPPSGSGENGHIGDRVFAAVFNSDAVATASKYMILQAMYLITSATAQNVYVNSTITPAGWSAWVPFASAPIPNPAVLVAPPNVGTGLAFAAQTLSWTAGTGSTPTGYKIYLGTDGAGTSTPTSIFNGTTQTATTKATGALTQNQTYYWQIVPYNGSGDATGCPIWSFSTRAELSPAVATNPVPADGATILVASYPNTQTLSWTAPTGLPIPTGYKVYIGRDNPPTNLVNGETQPGTSRQFSVTSFGTYYWQIVPYYIDPGTRTVKTSQPIAAKLSQAGNSVRASAIGAPVWSMVSDLLPSYSVEITSTPIGADIFVGGVDSGFNTPYTFSLAQGASATYTVQMAGYNFSPASKIVTNIAANTSQEFTGTILTYTVDISSSPTGAAIYKDGISTGHNTPYQFVMDWHTSGTYTVQLAGYSFTPVNKVVTNIAANTSQLFTGAVLTYTVDITSNPTNSDIIANGINPSPLSTNLFFSEYIEGTSNNKALEIFNGTGAPIDLSQYSVKLGTNGNTWGTTQILSGTLAPNDVYVIALSNASASILAQADITSNVVLFNGNDALGLFQGTTLIDMIGEVGVDPGVSTGWTVAGVLASTIDHTLIRKPSINSPTSNWTISAGTNATDSQWIVDPVDYLSNLGVHNVDTGFNTPHTFTMNYGTDATYTIVRAGYNWSPTELVVTNIQANTNQAFTGTLQTFNVDITSNPTDADIFIGGVDTNFNTPHTFALNYGTGATYTVQKVGYTWAPSSLVVSNIQANTSQEFTGTMITYSVLLTSNPTDARIFTLEQGVPVDTGFSTPHTFTMNYGTSRTYTVQKAGYNWDPTSFVVTNILANTSQVFTGTLQTFTVDISSNLTNVDIFVDGQDSSFNTPHTFTLSYGASATYTVQKTAYSFAPPSLVVTNIQANTSQNFVGTQTSFYVNLTSVPTNASIYNGTTPTGFTTPHIFLLPGGTNANYTVRLPGYNWAPVDLEITDISADVSQNFVGTLQTFNVDITSNPTNAAIYVDGVNSGYTTPHQFAMTYNTSALYTVQMAGYTWAPASFAVNNIQANTSQAFEGTIITFTVDITSNPSNASISVSGTRPPAPNTPHQFIMNYGSSATYSVSIPGYTWVPATFTVNNIRANASQLFVGTIIKYDAVITSNPSNADIFVGGVDSGFNTPHTFAMDYGSSATYTVQKTGYTWDPADFVVTNILANTSQEFTGTQVAYVVEITSTPTDATILVNGQSSGFNTPHQFAMLPGNTATYSVQKAGYTWAPATFPVLGIQQNESQNFVGTLLTYTVDISSNLTGTEIYVDGIDSGFPAPHQFVLNYGSNATYTVQKAGYSWVPSSFAVTNIQANTSQAFTGTLLTYTVDITSTPIGAEIFTVIQGRDGRLLQNGDTGFATPHQFVLNYGSNQTYYVQMPGYTFAPLNFVVTNIQANTSQNFVGTINTYTVDITSTPSDADIFVGGVDTGVNTPHQFVLPYGSNATYTVQKAGFTWAPANFVVTNIQANTAQAFTGNLITYTVEITSTPSNAAIYTDGNYTSFNTPHTFTLSYGTNLNYTLQLAGYSWAPGNFAVTNIQANTSQNFVGSLLTYTVDITSTPPGAEIFSTTLGRDGRTGVVGTDTNFTTPHQFILPYGSTVTYCVMKPHYTWAPVNFTVTNIQANANQNFVGNLITHTVSINSNPPDADIFVNGVDSGSNTPSMFVLTEGDNAVYTVQKAGYTWSPNNLTVTNISANTSQTFTGTLNTYTVYLTSTPSNATILVNGMDMGFTTPHQFVLNYGNSATYTVQQAGYTWSPSILEVTNIQSNLNQNFVGSLITYTAQITSNPEGAEIFTHLGNTGFVTPHSFTMNYGESEIYNVVKAGYDFTPFSFPVINIQANVSQNFVGTILSYSVNITSTPANAKIFVDGIDSGLLTPYVFTMNWGTSATYSVQKEGYSFAANSFAVTNIIENSSHNFVGSILTYTVDITSSPTDADIYVGGVDSGHNTPYQFTLNYGDNATYTVHKAGYTWSPENLVVSNIHANTGQQFTGTIITYTVDLSSNPNDADIFLNGVDTGYNTPHQFVVNYGTDATYSVVKTGYNWRPPYFSYTNIQANTSREFTGTLLTYTVDIFSTIVDADIYVNGQDSGFNTPHQFTLTYGSNATYTVQKAGYTWIPDSFVVTNIQANAGVTFIGTLLTYTVDITSTPASAGIYIDGVYSNFNTPHTFTMNYGSSATYSVMKQGYTWEPASFVVSNIQANTSQHFTGTIITFTVDITSGPTDADIFVGGVDTGFNTPHQFIMNFGSNATYTVQKAGYYWNPTNFVVTNIQANTSRNFAGTLITFNVYLSSTPTGARIYEAGVDTGFLTPHTFVLAQGAGGVYSVQKAGYSYTPATFAVTNIQANTSQAFTGSILTYSVNITSTPPDADIYIGGVDSGFNTPHAFTLNYGSNATYSVQKTGYTWAPDNFAVTNIQANAAQNFIGTLIPYNVNITSNPTNAHILINGIDSGFTTPHVFVMDYGTSALYTVQKTGYNWAPASFAVNNIHADASQLFTGTIITFTVNITSAPDEAAIYVDGVYSGYLTPHVFTMNYGTNATYTVQQTGYNYTPASFVVNNITANLNKNFVGALQTFAVSVTSTPADADIFINGVDTGFNSPHVFNLDYGTSLVFFLSKRGYDYYSAHSDINNLTSNTDVNFIGTIRTYTVDITSSPTNTDIFVNGVDSGFNTPHQFVMDFDTSATYTMQRLGYTWSPSSFVVNNIEASTSRNFVGSQITYTVDITSTPSNSDVYIGNEDTGLNTPCQLVLPQGANAVITIRNVDYSWSPESLVITNIQANTSQHFTGTLLTYTVNITSEPSDADIIVNGQDSGFNTPHVFTVNSGTYAMYGIMKAGYIWTPANFEVSNIHANVAQNFVGTLQDYTVIITSTPADADIYVGGVDTGYNTPHQFTMPYGSGATYAVQKPGYTWAPASYVVTNIQSNLSQNFTGTTVTYIVNITSNILNTGIYVDGVDSGFTTPHQFVMNYGTSATYTAVKAGYTYIPANLVITNIQANENQTFLGTIMTYTVNITSTPGDADIFVDGIDTGANTPHIFVLNYGSNATYTVQKTGYIFTPANLVVTNIHNNIVQNFAGTTTVLGILPENQSVSNLAGTATFSIGANVAWTVSETSDWFSVTPGNGSSDGILIVNYAANPLTTLRSGQIIVSGGSMISIATLTQEGADLVLSVSPQIQDISNLAGAVTINVTSNTSWTVTEAYDWITINPAGGNLNGTFEIAFLANPTPNPRSANISVLWGDEITTVTVNQVAGTGTVDPTAVPNPNLSVYPNPFGNTANIKVDVTNNNHAVVMVYSTKGELIRRLGSYSKGTHTISWDGKDEAGRRCSNGFYLIRYQSNDLAKTVKVLMMKN